ncbi:hypothetical protein [Microvirga sp. Mcv34]|uniref:hypothetical protein n=1 Tax=Microvirga sp. Mcv34 TaxID=2926016 RepID=UPI0021C8126E|nr:hypothetical protein [Microvirga sp. Mcv34]
MRFVVYSLIGAVAGSSIGAAGGFFGWLEVVRIKKITGVAVAGGIYFGFYLMLILGALGIAIGVWRAWIFRKRETAAALQV